MLSNLFDRKVNISRILRFVHPQKSSSTSFQQGKFEKKKISYIHSPSLVQIFKELHWTRENYSFPRGIFLKTIGQNNQRYSLSNFATRKRNDRPILVSLFTKFFWNFLLLIKYFKIRDKNWNNLCTYFYLKLNTNILSISHFHRNSIY